MTRRSDIVTLRCKVTLPRADRGRQVAGGEVAATAARNLPLRPRNVIDPSTVPRLTRALVLGHYLERLVRDGIVQDYTQLARRFGLSKARITQLTNLTLLAPDIQNRILRLTATDSQALTERTLRRAVTHKSWTDQRGAFAIPLQDSVTKSS